MKNLAEIKKHFETSSDHTPLVMHRGMALKLIQTVEAYERGIDNVLFQLTNEGITEVHVVEAIADDLRRVYAGEESEYHNPFYKGESK